MKVIVRLTVRQAENIAMLVSVAIMLIVMFVNSAFYEILERVGNRYGIVDAADIAFVVSFVLLCWAGIALFKVITKFNQ